MKTSRLPIYIIAGIIFAYIIAAFILPKGSEHIWLRLKSVAVWIFGSGTFVEMLVGGNKVIEKFKSKK